MPQNQEKISIQSLIDQVSQNKGPINCIGLSGTERAYILSRFYRATKRPLVVIVPTPKEAEKFIDEIGFFVGNNRLPILYFTPYNILPFKFLSYHNKTAANRIATLFQLIENNMPPIVVTTVGAVIQKVIPKQEIYDFAELLMVGEEIDRDILIQKLVSSGYLRSMIVEEPGDFCVRGGILDIFTPLYSDPLRIEFFGDTIESLRFFSATNQRTLKDAQEAIILPAREAVLKTEAMSQFIGRVRTRASEQNIPVTKTRAILDRIKEERVFPGIESLLPLIFSELDTFFDYVPEEAVFFLIDPTELEQTALEFEEQATKNYLAATDEPRLCVEPHKLYIPWLHAESLISQNKKIAFRTLPVTIQPLAREEFPTHGRFFVEDNSEIRMALRHHGDKDRLLLPLVQWIINKKQAGYLTVFVCRTPSQFNRLKSLLLPYALQPEVVECFPNVESDFDKYKGRVFISIGQISEGFVWPAEFTAIISGDEIFHTKHRKRGASREGVRTELLALEDLKQGDLVVHDDHGIGRYEGLVKLSLNGSTNDFLLIVYKDEDKLYLPVERMGMIQKYMGMDGIQPVLDKMGGKSWERVKAKVKRSAEKIAGELLQLYAVRKVKKGYAYKEVDSYLKDFEAGFSYEETIDQHKAIDEVLHDMEKPNPMDRLVCGDVGYGKTEVALRAAFITVYNGKQVAVLVPTTVLAEQHYATFVNRFERHPINIACLNRFRSLKQQRKIIEGLSTGKIDIVVGTHRLLQKDVSFRDLGLVVLDEEQRFGVKHKEKLIKIRSTVDVLALTATPIPRTLHMSLMGIRDISIISTPPEYRRSIITYISEYDDALVSDAIRKEIARGGQVFFIHNNIQTIWKMANHLKNLVPEVKMGIAHGRMDDDELESAMLLFMNKAIDLLVCTTIVESGLDIPSANTILVNRADKFGLAQIYQLRGRVGRSEEQAYAYLFIPNESALGKDAQKRLKVLMEHSDLGSGFQIAMNDLKIRGGGTILGAAQSGHIAAVGYDMFLRLMENAMSELKGEPIYEPLEPEIYINMSAFIPEYYIPDIDLRLAAYRRLAKMRELEEITDFKDELIDRFGKLPAEATNLLLKIMLKILSIKAGVKRIELKGQQLFLHFSEDHLKNHPGCLNLTDMNRKYCESTSENVLKADLTSRNLSGLLGQTKNILKEIAQNANF